MTPGTQGLEYRVASVETGTIVWNPAGELVGESAPGDLTHNAQSVKSHV